MSQQLPSVSVVIPSYNHAAYIEDAIDSVFEQQIDGLQLVVIDDGSSDNSLELMQRYRQRPGFEFYPQANQGAHAALNRGIELTHGELILILNSDDSWDPGRIADLRQRFAAHKELVLAASWLRVVDGQGETLAIKQAFHNLPPWSPPRPGPQLSESGEPSLALLESNYISTTSNVAFRRQVWRQGVRFQALRYAHDWDFVLAACQVGELEILEQPSVRYRVHGKNTIREGTDLGKGLMRFEILWSVARHANALIERWAAKGYDRAELERRLWTSAPRFGNDALFAQLLALRGGARHPGSAYDALIRQDHPFRDAAVRQLAAAAD